MSRVLDIPKYRADEDKDKTNKIIYKDKILYIYIYRGIEVNFQMLPGHHLYTGQLDF